MQSAFMNNFLNHTNVLFRYANSFIICFARRSSISSCLGTGCFFTCFRINIKIVTGHTFMFAKNATYGTGSACGAKRLFLFSEGQERSVKVPVL